MSGNNGESLSYSYVQSHTETLHQKEEIQDRIDTLLSLAETCNIPLKDDKTHWISQRAPKPFNKFAEKNNALGQAFPQIFPLGNVYSMQSDITPAQTQHLLLQFDCCAASCRELIFFLFDEAECKKNIIGISRAVKAGKLDDFVDLYNCTTFKSRLIKAVDDPSGKDALWIMKKFFPS